jgi:hypothetical protein
MLANSVWNATDFKQQDSCKGTCARGVQEVKHQVNGAFGDADASKSITALSNTFQISMQMPDPYKSQYRHRHPNRRRHQSWLLTWQCFIQYSKDSSENTQAGAYVSTTCENQKAEWISRTLCTLVCAATDIACSIGNYSDTILTFVTTSGVTSVHNLFDVIYNFILKSVWMFLLPL